MNIFGIHEQGESHTAKFVRECDKIFVKNAKFDIIELLSYYKKYGMQEKLLLGERTIHKN